MAAENMTRSFKFNKFGLAEEPRGHHVALELKSRTLLGEVIDAYRNFATGNTHIKVEFFNGELWPIDPLAIAVKVLIQTLPENSR